MEKEISLYTPNGGGQDKLPYNKTHHVLGPHHPNSSAQNNPQLMNNLKFTVIENNCDLDLPRSRFKKGKKKGK